MEPSDVHHATHAGHPTRRVRRRAVTGEALDERLHSIRDALRTARQGDFSIRLPTNGAEDGVVGEIAHAFNALVEQNELLVKELGRVDRAVGMEGRTTERASLGPSPGSWALAVGSVNSLIERMARPVTEANAILELVAAGDLSRDMSLHLDGAPLQGDFLELGRTVKTVVSRLRSVSSGVSRVVREMGTEGKLGGQAPLEGLAGAWKDLVDDVNLLAGNLTAQVRNIALVSTAIAKGDLSQKITVETRGEILELKNAINATVDQLRSFSAEVIRVAREVGTEGKLGAQADVRGVSGVWQELTDSVNRLAGNLTSQVRNIAAISTAIANGDLSQKITVEAKGEILELKNTINATLDQLRAFAAEVTRVAREVGTEGRLGAQADVKGVSGTWKDLTDNVNLLAGNLTNQVRNIAAVTTAVANGDLSRKITVEARGEILELKNTVNAMVDRLQTFAAEVTRVAKEVGTEGKLGGQADVKGVSGTWRDLTDNVNLMAGNLTDQVRGIAKVVTAVATGDLSQKFVVEAKGEIAELADTINSMTDSLRTFADQVTTVAREVGIEGKLGGQARVPGVSGTWRELTDNVNLLAGNLTNQVRNIALVTTAVANGDLSQKITVEARGEILELKNTINVMVDQLRNFASEVTRIAKEVGTEGKLGAQADIKGVAGTWKDLTDNVNLLAGNLTNQVRNIALVTTAVANGDLSQKITVEAKGEILELKNTVNTMVEQLRAFAAEVTRVAKEVGTEGKLGGQADVKGVSGTWKDLTDNVNQMASNLTNQVRGIAKVVTAVADGDLSQKFVVEAKGEIAALADTINNMTESLRTFADQVSTVAREVGIEGKLGGQARVPGVAGRWRALTDNVNLLASNLTNQVRNIALITTAVANGDLSQKITVEASGEILELKNTINAMVDRLQTFASEVTRVAKEVGTEGKLGGQAEVKGVSGTWKDLTDNVNFMASNLTSQVRGIVKVVTAVATGDLSQKFVVEAKGEIAALADTINNMTDTLRLFAEQVITVAREVGIEGKLGGQARVPGVSGTWKDLTDNVNLLAGNLTNQVRNIALVTTAVANGDLSQKITVDVKGEVLELKNTINTMVEQLRTFAAEVTRVAREVGTEGKLGGQADVKGVSGTWKDLTDNVNLLAGNLTNQVRNIAAVTTAVANGDLSKKITVEALGEILELKNTVNVMVDQLRAFAAEVTRVAREVGTEGKLGGQAQVSGVAGTWKDLTENVNFMASNLTNQVRGIVKVVTAVANGDLSQKFVLEAKGEIAALADTINAMTDTLRTFAEQVSTVAREVGTEGKLGGQAKVPGAAGTWRDLTDNVNMLAGNLTNQVRNIAAVTTSVATGDLSQKITVDARGEILELKNTINAMVEQLRTFAGEVTRVAREVGTDGRLGGQAQVPGVAGTWKDLTDNVNVMASNLTSQVRGIAKVVTAVANGDLAQKLVLEARGEIAALADTINDMTDTLRTFSDQVTTVAREVGIEGKLGGQARVPGAAGTWKDLTDSVNTLAGNLTAQVRNIALVTTAVANGDLSKKISVEAKGEILELKDTINAMVEQLRTFAAEVTRVAREVGTDGQLGGQARVPGVSGTWKDLTDSVNLMASNLTDQVRGISKVVTSVAGGDLNKKLVLVAKGEIAALADTINNMTETLRTFADQVTTVAREVGIEGKLGGQAKVPGAAGTWRDLTDNVNQLAANLTSQVRAIFEVATAVIQGDLTRSITVEARGEVLGLKDTINQMITNLRDTTQANKEQDWLKTNLAKFFGLMQGQRSLQSLTDQIMSDLTPVVGAQHGAFYLADTDGTGSNLSLTSSYAYSKRKHLSNRFSPGEGLVGQCARERKPIVVTEVPEDYVQITSGLGEAPPRNIAVYPVFFEDQVRGVIELGSFHQFTAVQLAFLEQLMLSIGLAINLIGTSTRTEQLLQQLQGSNVELDKRRKELEERARQLESRNREIAEASASLESKSQELARVSQYKSQFLTNMSHEVRTPLNSMMILAQMLAANEDGNLSPKQQEWAATIHSAGRDLLALINQILDLSKVEAGRIETHLESYQIDSVQQFAERTFRPVALQRGIEFGIEVSPDAPRAVMTDRQLLDQILKNLLANAFKFTEHGRVVLRIERAPAAQVYRSASLQRALGVVAFAVTDSGIGIPPDQVERIFEAFQQADSSITRKYGGTGLGLTISREYSRVLGGEITVKSAAGVGSTFTLFLPIAAESPEVPETAPTPAQQLEAPPPPAVVGSEAPPAPAKPVASEDLEALAGRRVLVVEDDARNLYAVTSLLEKHRMIVMTAASAREAFGKLREHADTDLILMDVMMPEMDGYQATREIRSHRETAHLPVIALTAKASASDQAQCMAAGFNDYMVKPADTRQLLSVLLRNLRPEE
jgi:HAMP domain-containing protein/signal transduction histidine kinase/ActR/RegA family two-component response regulator